MNYFAITFAVNARGLRRFGVGLAFVSFASRPMLRKFIRFLTAFLRRTRRGQSFEGYRARAGSLARTPDADRCIGMAAVS